MKVGILTFVNAPNFGAILQAYASQEFIQSLKIDANLINYTPSAKNSESCETSQINPISNKFLNLRHPIKTYQRKKKSFKLNNFKSEFLKISKQKYYGEITELKENYDTIIAGSDQIWNTDLSFGSKSFFLDFKTNARKTGYAVSTGRQNLSELDCQMIHKYINNFETLSVREESLKKYLKQNEKKECKLVCDPVFLLKEKNWNKLAITPKTKNYILVYTMEINDALINAMKKLKKETGKKILCINGGSSLKISIADKTLNTLGPREFIGYIKSADIILTNSFHGAAFSVIFKRKLIVLEHSLRNERLCQLLTLCGYPEHFLKLNDKNYNLDNYFIDTVNAYENMEDFIEESKEYMKSLCQENQNERE